MAPVSSRYLFTLLLSAMLIHASAQESRPWAGFGIEADPIAGRVFKHTVKFELPEPSLTTGLDLNFAFQTYGRADWEQRRKYPLLGVSLTYINYGIDSIYGRSIGLSPNIQIPLIIGKKLEWTIRVGDGIGYISRHFERSPVNDTINNAIGSRINDFFIFMTDVRYRVNRHWDISLGGNFTHISDASAKQPNLGINVYGAHLGVRYFPVTSQPERIARSLPVLSHQWLLQLHAGMAFDQYAAPQGPEFPVYLGSIFVSRRYASRNKMYAGIDYSYHTSVYAFLRNNDIYPGQEADHSWKSAIFIGNEFLLGRVGIIGQVGYYIKQAYLALDPIYEKIGGNLYLVKKETGPIKELAITAYLKTHRTIAELAEFGINLGL